MKRTITLTTMALVIGLSLPTSGVAQTAEDLVGTWVFVGSTNVGENGRKVDVFGANPKGLYIFDNKGRFVSTNVRSDLPKFASDNRNQGTPDENKAVVQGSLFTFGSYSVAGKIISYKVEGSSWPSWTGTEQKRTITAYTGDELTYTLPGSIGGISETKIRRLK